MKTTLGLLAILLLVLPTALAWAGDEPPASGTPDEAGTPPAQKAKADAGQPEADATDDQDVELAIDWLPQVVVSAERLYVTPLDHGGARSVMAPKVLRRSGQSRIEEVMRLQPSVQMHFETESGTKPNMGMRGLNPERSIETTFMVDGIPLAPAPYGHPGQSIFPFTLERVRAVDILRGGYAVRYGPNNVAGVVNFLSNPIPKEPTFKERIRAGSHGEFSSYTAVGTTFEDFGFLLEEVYRRGDTQRANGEYWVTNFGAKVAWTPGNDLTLLFQVDHFKERSNLPGGLNLAGYRQDRGQNQSWENYFEGDQLRGNVRVIWEPSADERFEVLYYTFSGDRTFYLGRPTQYGLIPTQMRSSPRPMAIWAVQPQYTRRLNVTGVAHKVTVGVRHEEERITSQRFTWNWPNGPKTTNNDEDYEYSTWSAYLDDTFRPARRLELTPGVRFEWVDIEAIDNLTGIQVHREFTEVLPGVTAVYWLRNDWTIYGNVQRSFRAPDQARIEVSAKPQDVEAEKAWAYEVGTRVESGRHGLFFDATLFRIDFGEKLAQDPLNQDVYRNIGEQRHQGVELSAQVDLGKRNRRLQGVEVHAGYAYVDTEILKGPNKGHRARQAPAHKATWGVGYEHRCGAWAAVDGQWVDEAFADEENTRLPTADGMLGVMPDYSLWSARVGYGVDFPCKRGRIDLEVGVNNAFDGDFIYRRPGQGIIPGPGRAWFAELQFELKL